MFQGQMISAQYMLNKLRTVSLAREPEYFSINISKMSISKDPVGGSSLRACFKSEMVILSSKKVIIVFIIIRIDWVFSSHIFTMVFKKV